MDDDTTREANRGKNLQAAPVREAAMKREREDDESGFLKSEIKMMSFHTPQRKKKINGLVRVDRSPI